MAREGGGGGILDTGHVRHHLVSRLSGGARRLTHVVATCLSLVMHSIPSTKLVEKTTIARSQRVGRHCRGATTLLCGLVLCHAQRPRVKLDQIAEALACIIAVRN